VQARPAVRSEDDKQAQAPTRWFVRSFICSLEREERDQDSRPGREELSAMMELTVTLDFACFDCENSVQVTVQCRGEGLLCQQQVEGALATVNIPCPTCGQINQLLFEPSGQIRSVRPYRCFRVVPEPSVN